MKNYRFCDTLSNYKYTFVFIVHVIIIIAFVFSFKRFLYSGPKDKYLVFSKVSHCRLDSCLGTINFNFEALTYGYGRGLLYVLHVGAALGGYVLTAEGIPRNQVAWSMQYFALFCYSQQFT